MSVEVLEDLALDEALGLVRTRLPREAGATGAFGGGIDEEVLVSGTGGVKVLSVSEVEVRDTAVEPSAVALLIEVKTEAAVVVTVGATDARRERTLVVGNPVGGNILSIPTDRLPVGNGYVSASPRKEEGRAKLP